jgi:cell division transport system permease protein
MNRYVFVNFFRTLRSSWRIYAMAAVMSAVAYGIFGAFFLLHRNVSATTRLWVASVPVTLVLDAQISPEQRQALLAQARQAGANHVNLVTPEEGKRRLESSSGGAKLLAGFDENPLPPMLELTFEAPPPASKIEAMRDWAGDVEVDDAAQWSERFRSLLMALDRVGMVLGLILFGAALAVASLSVRLVAFNHAADREIQRLVGAPESFIQMPYLLAGASLGLVGAAGALGALGAMYAAAAAIPMDGWLIPIHKIVFFSPVETVVLVVSALLIGILGAWLGLGKSRPA